MYSNLVDVVDEFQIETSSINLYYYKFIITDKIMNFDFQDGSSFQLPLFCNLIENCPKNQFIILKVIIKLNNLIL